MVRGWIGAGILAVFLVLGLLVGWGMDKAHVPTEQLLAQAAEKTLQGEFAQATALGAEAKSRWERHWNNTATVADQSPMDDIDDLFGEMEIYAKMEEQPHFAAVCRELSQRVQAVASAHRFRWWNIL